MSQVFAQVAVEIERDNMTILPREFPAHELPIAQGIFGEENVRVIEGAKPEPVELDPEGEVGRLEQKYGTGALEKAYGVNFKSGIAKAMKDAEVKKAKAAA